MGSKSTHNSLIQISKSLRERDQGSDPSYLQGVPPEEAEEWDWKITQNRKTFFFPGVGKEKKVHSQVHTTKFLCQSL